MLKKLERAEFEERMKRGKCTPVYRTFLADRETPVAAFSRLGEDEDAFLLESVAGGETRGRYSYIGLEPYGEVQGEALEELRDRFAEKGFVAAEELKGLQGGAVGYVAYDAVAGFEKRVKLEHEAGTPAMRFMLCDKLVVFDNVSSTVKIVVVSGDYDAAMAEIDKIHRRLLSAESIAEYMRTHAGDGMRRGKLGEFRPEMTAEEYEGIVRRCKEEILNGEVIQIVPSQKFTAECTISGLQLYRALRVVNPSPYNFIMRIGGKTLIGSSPEELVKLQGGTASTAPIAGTRRRGKRVEEDAALEEELKHDEKELAEHVMLVDLGRNDLGRVCETGTVQVKGFAHVERYSHVMHLVTNVSGKLERGRDAFDLLKAAFPAGTLSGAPKVRAMELLAELEKSPRGIYGGAAGYFSYNGDMDFAIVIRTMILADGVLTMRAGAGIVADSDPRKEYEETVNKSRAIFEAAKFAEELI